LPLDPVTEHLVKEHATGLPFEDRRAEIWLRDRCNAQRGEVRDHAIDALLDLRVARKVRCGRDIEVFRSA